MEQNASQTTAPRTLLETAGDIGRALGLQATGHAEEAIAAFLGIVASEPDNVIARYSLACLLSERNRPLEALQQINEAIRANNLFAPSYLARSLINSNMQRFEESLQDARTAILIDPTTTGLLSHWVKLKQLSPPPYMRHIKATLVGWATRHA